MNASLIKACVTLLAALLMLAPLTSFASGVRLQDMSACQPPHEDDGVFERRTRRCLLRFTDRGADREAVVRIAARDVVVQRVHGPTGGRFKQLVMRSSDGAVEVTLDLDSDEAEAQAEGREYMLYWGRLTVSVRKAKRSYLIEFARGG